MCGIAGLISGGRTSPDLAGEFADTLAHRGPDDRGVWTDKAAGIGLGHRRLSIVDLSVHGHQPMISANGRWVIVYNGEIYNHASLRSELDRAGLAPEGGWRGDSDTETFLECIAHWGLERALEKAVGMFALGLWDRAEQRLSLVRDRFGEKPLYYGWVGGDFLFASELKALRRHPGFCNEIDPAAVETFVARTYIPAPQSIYRHIFKLTPGCILELGRQAPARSLDEAPAPGTDEAGVRLTRYWSYADVVRAGLDQPIDDEQEAISRLEDALSTAIRGQAVADVPIGAFLSGGIDSSTIVALYQKYSSLPVRSFTIGFHEEGFDESDHARQIAAHLGTEHSERYVTARETRDVIPLLPGMYDEPFADSSQIPTFLVSRFAREQVTVALTGDGGDELLCGYSRYAEASSLWRALRHAPRSVRSASLAPLARVPSMIWNRVANGLRLAPHRHWGSRIHKAIRVGSAARTFDEVYSSLLHQWPFERSPAGGAGSGLSGKAFDFGGSAPDAVRAMYCDANAYLPDAILCKVDRAGMATSLETRVPFLDHRVAEIAARIPLSMKLQGGRGKSILRRLLGRELPVELFDRPKSGFALPVGEWLKGPLRGWAEDLLDPRRLSEEGWFDVGIIQRRWQQHLSGERNSADAMWAILMFQSWLRRQSDCSEAASLTERARA